MWYLKKIQANNLPTGNGWQLFAHNQTHGTQAQGRGVFTPLQCARAFSDKLKDENDPHAPKDRRRVAVYLVGAHSAEDYARILQDFAQILPLAELTRAADFAKASAGLQAHKMQKMPRPRFPAFSAPGSLETSVTRAMQQTAAQSRELDPLVRLAQLKALKSQREAEKAQKLARLAAFELETWAFQAVGFLPDIAEQLLQEPPTDRFTFTFGVMFIQ